MSAFIKQIPTDIELIPCAYHNSVVFDKSLYIYGGANSSTTFGHMFSSRNLRNWVMSKRIKDENGNLIPPMDTGGMIEFNNRIYLMAGWTGSIFSPNVYVSQNMVIWEKLPPAPWAPRQYFGCCVFQDKLFVIGGFSDLISNNIDVWWTRDCIQWHRIQDAPWSPIWWQCKAVSFNGKMYVLLANSSDNNQIWATNNGINWIKMPMNDEFQRRLYFAFITFENKMIIVSGGSQVATHNDIWYSKDGVTWKKATDAIVPNINGIFGMNANCFNNELIIHLGLYKQGLSNVYSNDIYSVSRDIFV